MAQTGAGGDDIPIEEKAVLLFSFSFGSLFLHGVLFVPSSCVKKSCTCRRRSKKTLASALIQRRGRAEAAKSKLWVHLILMVRQEGRVQPRPRELNFYQTTSGPSAAFPKSSFTSQPFTPEVLILNNSLLMQGI